MSSDTKPLFSDVKTVKDWILSEYATVIARAILQNKGERLEKMSDLKKHYGLIRKEYDALKHRHKSMSDYIRDEETALKLENECVYCGSSEGTLTMEHIIPRNVIGSDLAEKGHNLVLSCKSCNSSKGDREFLSWWASKFGEDSLPRKHALSKYLKFLYRLHHANGTLNNPWTDWDIFFEKTRARKAKREKAGKPVAR